MISNAFTVYANLTGTSQSIAFEYQTYGGQEYIQFFVTGSATGGVAVFQVGVAATRSPIIPLNGAVYPAVQTAASIVNTVVPNLPSPLNLIKPGVTWSHLTCNGKTWLTG